ncbi:pimeloyl-ACP methyl ester carboxylesterase [Humitalea rosea]|uniref:Pimeloyl-ACP methyl ester carboxylesterase n=1 Tax=Humitalea rosea TaxID=990373 RepID=A0A2W7IIV8_9PROT|nr:alpha/beta hydrolase [Humitalea rosea]PZW45594.1 pimeloyl-ACP methyl ester carboxylesterase [Humitalea rosea]
MTAPRLVRFAARDGLPLAAYDWAGPEGRTPVLCLPGLCRTGMDFAAIAARNAGIRRVVAMDYAGHGESGRPEELGRYKPEHALRDVLDACAALHLHRAVVVGTSFGGLLSMLIAVLRPALLRGIVLNDIGPHIEAGGLEHVQGFAGTDPALGSMEEAAAYMERVVPTLGLDAAGWRRFAGLTYAPGEDGRLHPRWDVRIAEASRTGPPADLWQVWRGVADLPVLLLWGEASTILSAATVARMRREKRGLRVISLPGIGHAPPLEGEAAMTAVTGFLDEID